MKDALEKQRMELEEKSESGDLPARRENVEEGAMTN